MPRLSNTERERAIGMLTCGRSTLNVARTFNVHPTTINRLQRRLAETGTTADRPRPGAPRVTTPADDNRIRLSHLRNRFRMATQTAREIPGRNNPRISAQTVRNRLRGYGLRARRPYKGLELTPARRRARRDWVTTHGRWTLQQWNNVLFTDESRFCIDNPDGRQRVWRRTGERYDDANVVQHNRWGGPSVMVWAGISFHHRTELHFIEGNINSNRYLTEILQPVAVPLVRRHGLVFQQDNARPHTARVCTRYLQAQNVNVLPWPAYSPDLSPIEHLWDTLGRAVRRRVHQPANVRQLRIALREEWTNIPRHEIQRLISSMRRRCTAVRDAHGGHTRY